MSGHDHTTTVGQLPNTATGSSSRVPAVLTQAVWLSFAVSLAALVGVDGRVELAGVLAVDGLTTVMWTVVAFFAGIVLSYSRRYTAGNKRQDAFFGKVFGFSLTVMVLAAADHFALFVAAWLVMGLVMASLIGHVRGWKQARAAGSVARRYFVASSGLVAAALGLLWWATGATTITGVVSTVEATPTALAAAGLLVLAAMIQSALLPFQGWLLSSMTAPTPASALMHAGFVNAGGVLLTRFAPVVSLDPTVMLLIVAVGAVSALGGKLLKSVQPDVKRRLGCSTVGQMGFMIMQAGLGFFGAAITHLILHGFYKAYQFLSSGGQVEQTAPKTKSKTTGGLPGVVVTVLVAIAGGVLFAVLTGKGTKLGSGLLLVVFVVLTTLQAARSAVKASEVSPTLRYGVLPVIFLPAIAVYAAVYTAITAAMTGVPLVTAGAALSLGHAVVGAVFVAAYLAVETGLYRRSDRLYVALLNAAKPDPETLLTDTEEYNEY